MSVQASGEPFELGGGDELLGVLRQFPQERGAADQVEFTENVKMIGISFYVRMEGKAACRGALRLLLKPLEVRFEIPHQLKRLQKASHCQPHRLRMLDYNTGSMIRTRVELLVGDKWRLGKRLHEGVKKVRLGR